MTRDEAVALSLVPGLSRVALTERLKLDDPGILEEARRFLDQARTVRLSVEAAGVGVVAWNDPRFPSTLLAVADAPPALWYRGALEALDAPAVAIVGSRAASPAALETAAQLGSDLAARGIGMASADDRSIAFTWSGRRSGRASSSSATAPDTTAAACELPLPLKKRASTRAVGCASSMYEPGTRRDAMLRPGATRSTRRLVSPRLLNSGTMSSPALTVFLVSEAPTASTYGS